MQKQIMESLIIQRRVVGALIVRELLTRYGRHNLGFLWLFLEPVLFTLGIVVLWSLTKTHAGEFSIVAFAITGYSTVLMWRNTSGRLANAIEPNLSLLYHRNVKVIDIFLARFILEVAGITISFVTLVTLCSAVGVMPYPDNVFLMSFAWLLLAFFAFGLCLIIGVISETSEVFDRIWHTFTYLFFPFSGAVYFVDALPSKFQKLALYIPTVHATEMLRHGYYGSPIITHESPEYLFSTSAVMIFFGLLGLMWLGKKVEPE